MGNRSTKSEQNDALQDTDVEYTDKEESPQQTMQYIDNLEQYNMLIITSFANTIERNQVPIAIITIIAAYYTQTDKYLYLITTSSSKGETKIAFYNLNTDKSNKNVLNLTTENALHYQSKCGYEMINNIQLPQWAHTSISQKKLNPFQWNILLRIGGFGDNYGFTDKCDAIIFHADESDIGYNIDIPNFPFKGHPTTTYNKNNNILYCIGGSSIKLPSTKIITLNMKTLKYNTMESVEVTIGRNNCSLCWQYDYNQLYILGGVDGQRINNGKSCELLNIMNDSCIRIANMNKRRVQCGSIIMKANNNLIVGGGIGNTRNGVQDADRAQRTIEIYDSHKNVWNIYGKLLLSDHEHPILYCYDDNPFILYIAGDKYNNINGNFGPYKDTPYNVGCIERIDFRDANAEWQYVSEPYDLSNIFDLRQYKHWTIDKTFVVDL